MEQSENNTFIQALNNEQPQIKKSVITQDYPVNPLAEKVVNLLASILLWVGIIGSVALLFASIYEFADAEDEAGLILLGIAVVLIVISVIEWAIMKVFVNISNNLYNINSTLNRNR